MRIFTRGRAASPPPKLWVPDAWVHFERVVSDNDLDETRVELNGSGFNRIGLLGVPEYTDSYFWAVRVKNVPDDGTSMRLLNSYPSYANGGAYFQNINSSLSFLREDATSDIHHKIAFNAQGPGYTGGRKYFSGTGWANAYGGKDITFTISVCGSTGKMVAAAKTPLGRWSRGTYRTGGVTPTPPTWPSTSQMIWHNDVTSIFGHNYKFTGDVAFAWLAVAEDDSAFVDVEDQQIQRILSRNPETWDFIDPIIWFQGSSTEWNTGVNRGYGGDFSYYYPTTDPA